MPIRMVQITAHTRSRGHTAAGALAYRHGLDLTCPRTGELHEYSARQEAGHVVAEGMARGFAEGPAVAVARGTPAIGTPAALAAEIERTELRQNSQILRDIQIALPIELNGDAREALTGVMAQAVAGRYRTVVSWAIHRSHRGDSRNHHAHLIVPTRALAADDPDGRLGKKLRQLCERPGSQAEIKWIRETWVRLANEKLAREGIEARLEAERPLDLEVPGPVVPDPDRLPDLTRAEVGVERREAREAGIDPTGVGIRDLLQRVQEPYTRAGQILVARLERLRIEGLHTRPEVAPAPARPPVQQRRLPPLRARPLDSPPRAAVLRAALEQPQQPRRARLVAVPRPVPPRENVASVAAILARIRGPLDALGQRLRGCMLTHLDFEVGALEMWAERLDDLEPPDAAAHLNALGRRLEGSIWPHLQDADAYLEAWSDRLDDVEPVPNTDEVAEPPAPPAPRDPAPQSDAAAVVPPAPPPIPAPAPQKDARHMAIPEFNRLVVAPVDDPEAGWQEGGLEDEFAVGQEEAMVLRIAQYWESGYDVAIEPRRSDVSYTALRGSAAQVEALERDGYRPWMTLAVGERDRIAVLALERPLHRTPEERRAAEAALAEWRREMAEADGYGLAASPAYPSLDGSFVRLIEAPGGICQHATERLAEIWRLTANAPDPDDWELPTPGMG